jgi:HAD superfamily hydrolase (TIGR01549 family)
MSYKQLLSQAKQFYQSSIPEINFSYINRICKQAENVSIVSFDIFDTICTRLFECPIDLFAYVAKILEENDKSLKEFGINRFYAEEKAREVAWQSEQREDITYDEIYVHLSSIYPQQKDIVEFAKNVEIQTELNSIVANIEQKYLIEKLKQSGKKIIFVSDMYLSKLFIEKMLANIGLNIYDKLYISSEFMKAKYTGHLWNIVIKDNPEESILHIGDNLKADIKMPRKYGIKTVHYKKLLGSRRVGAELAPELIPFSLMTKIQRLQNKDIPKADCASRFWFVLGETLGGIILKSFIDWLCAQVIKDKIDHIYFFARDAQIIYKAWDLLGGDDRCGTTSSYFCIARSSIRFPSCHIDLETNGKLTEASLYSLVEETMLPGDTWQVYFKRLGISEEHLKNTSFKKKFGSFKDDFDYKYVAELKKFIQEELLVVLAPIFANEYQNAYEYYKQEGMLDKEKRIAVVDLGWGGTNQLVLTEFREFLGIRKKLRGYYYGLLNHNAPGRLYHIGPMKTAFFNMFSRPFDKTFMQNFMYILENLHSGNHETTIGYRKTLISQRYEPVFRKDYYHQYIDHYNKTYKLYQDGALVTLQKWKNKELVYGIDEKYIDKFVAKATLYQICISPNYNERKFLGKIEHAIVYDHSVCFPLIKKELPRKKDDIVSLLYLWPCGVMSYWQNKKKKMDLELYQEASRNFEKWPLLIKNYLIG